MVRLVCPDVVIYTAAFQARAAAELSVLPEGSALAEMVRDYGQLRDRIRACQERSS